MKSTFIKIKELEAIIVTKINSISYNIQKMRGVYFLWTMN